MAVHKPKPSYLAPDYLYTYQGFIDVSGINKTRMREARVKHGIEPQWLSVGRRKFLRGSDAIEYVLQLAAIENTQSPARE